MKTGALNQLINFFWTIACFAPVCWFWFGRGWDGWLPVFLFLSFVFGLLPYRLLKWTEFASSRRGYEKLGARTFRKFTQNGDWANAASGNAGNTVGSLEGAENYLKTIAMYERFHLICGCFFLLTALYACYTGQWLTGLLVLAANYVYNFAAIVLQQYNRLRIRRLLEKGPADGGHHP